MKLLLDEMWSPEIAVQLRARGQDVEAVVGRDDLVTRSDAVVFLVAQVAQMEGRASVTNDVVGFRELAERTHARGDSHAGLIFTSDRSLSRSDTGAIGRMVTALHALCLTNRDMTNVEVWLKPVSG